MQQTPIPIVPGPGLVKPEVGTSDVAEDKVEITTDVPQPSVLEDLTAFDCLLITKRILVKSVFMLKGLKNKFEVTSSNGSVVYTVKEENSWWISYLGMKLRPFQLRVLDPHGNEVMMMNRPFAYTTCVFPFQLQHMEVFSPPGNLVGTIQQAWTVIRPKYLVRNAEGQDVFGIRGPLIPLGFFKSIKFRITYPDGNPVGTTMMNWDGFLRAMILSGITKRSEVSFESTLPVEEKALLFAATLLLGYMYN